MKLEVVMKRPALALLVAVAGACTADYPSLYIQQNQVPGEGCVISGSPGDFISEGFVDVTPSPGTTGSPGYLFTPLIINSTTAGTSATDHLMFIEGANIALRSVGSTRSDEIVGALATQDLDRIVARFGASIEPGGSIGAAFSAINSTQANFLFDAIGPGEQVQVIARVTVFGTIDGRDIDGLPFEYPITICSGCLLRDLGPCAELPEGEMGSAGGICNPLQDGVLECCDNFNVCPAVGPTTGT